MHVAAVVLTFNASTALEHCLDAIRSQTRPPERIVVVDNASDAPVDAFVRQIRNATLLRLDENTGPAGGYAAGLQEFAVSGADWAWVMDDDCVPAANALAEQLVAAGDAPSVVLATMVDRDTGATTNTQGWCGVLIARSIVEAVGVPDAELFWWTEDTEYLQWRIPRAGFPVVRCTTAIVEVGRTRAGAAKPAWKYYYEARNQVYYRLHTQRPSSERPVPRSLKLRVRTWRAVRSVAKLTVRASVREGSERARKVTMVGRGTVDGLHGRLGPTVPVDIADRPVEAS